MLWRRLCLARAWLAAGLLSSSMFAAPAMAEPEEPAPAADLVTETVRVLDARQTGDLTLEVRGNGQERVRLALHNTSAKRLNVILPPGLVASSATAQAGGGRGFQSMGLGLPTNRSGSFGQFQGTASDAGFQSVPVSPSEPRPNVVTVPAGKTIDLTLPAVCLNFGLPTPTFRDKFELVDVDDYTTDPRVRRALRTLATQGTSLGVAQATMWRVCNGVPFDVMRAQAGSIINIHEVALAARFVEALEMSGDTELVEPSYLTESRIFIQVQGEGDLTADAKRLDEAMEGLHVLGLPVQRVDREPAQLSAPALLLKVVLTGSRTGETRGRVLVSRASHDQGWTVLGKTTFTEGSTASVLDGAGLSRALDHALASAFVSVKIARRGPSSTTLKIENRLPFTLANVTIKAGGSSGAAPLSYKGVGVGPARATLVTIQAPSGTIDRVELNGL